MLGKPEDVEKFITSPGLVKLIMVEFPRTNGTMRDYTRLCEAHGVRLLVVADLDKIFGHPVAVFEDKGMFFLGLREEPLEDPINRFLKRCLDIGVSTFVVGFVLPIAAVVVRCAQVLQSPGPLIYKQKRPGFQNRPFDIFKFRTLHVNNPEVDRLPTSDDPRVFAAGRWFRKLSIDELPQFINVLLGEMSVVGPRPHLMSDNERFPTIYHRAYVRSFLKPGITGLAQVRGYRGKAETPQEIALRMESDIEYLETWSFWLDCWLILRTALQMLKPPKTAI